MPLESIKCVLTCRKEWVGAILGKGGENIKRVRKELRMNIVINPPGNRKNW